MVGYSDFSIHIGLADFFFWGGGGGSIFEFQYFGGFEILVDIFWCHL